MSGVQFGIFDWLDDGGQSLAQAYEQRLRMLEYADRAGYFAYHLAEHHGTPLSTAPSPNLFFALVAQRTKQLRFGPMVYLLGMYQPVRLIEEICVLDQLSGGRLELGVGRPASPFEAAIYGMDVAESRPMALEALELLTRALATGEIDYDGRYYQMKGVRLTLRPLQQPYPPLWYPTLQASSVPWIAEHGFSIMLMFLFTAVEATGEQLRLYRQLLREHAGKPGRLNGHVAEPKQGFAIQIYVADTDAEARRVAREAHARFFHNFNYLWERNGVVDRHAARADFDTFVNQGMMAVGSPETVRATLQQYLDLTGANYLAGCFSFGNLSDDQILRSLDLFTTQVRPRLIAPPPDETARS
jgi:alkanesulfonate monooxygenase SsuD/methylene tetrahydromethanopterin reductase-like flavin-dependent oxidoreductase (luciferase family)